MQPRVRPRQRRADTADHPLAAAAKRVEAQLSRNPGLAPSVARNVAGAWVRSWVLEFSEGRAEGIALERARRDGYGCGLREACQAVLATYHPRLDAFRTISQLDEGTLLRCTLEGPRADIFTMVGLLTGELHVRLDEARIVASARRFLRERRR